MQNFLQTNGVLVDQDWIDFFQRNNVAVGVSIDGSPDAHDKNRVTRRAHVVVLADEAIRSEEGSAAARLAAHVDYLANAEELDGINEDNLDLLLKGRATRLVVLRAGDEAGLSNLCARVDWLRQVRFPRDAPFVAGRVGGRDPALFVFSIASLTDLDDVLDELKVHWVTDGVLGFSPRPRDPIRPG